MPSDGLDLTHSLPEMEINTSPRLLRRSTMYDNSPRASTRYGLLAARLRIDIKPGCTVMLVQM